MKAVKAIFENGQLRLTEPAPVEGPVEVLVVFPQDGDAAWEKIENEATMRPGFAKFMEECHKEIDAGKATPLDLNQL